MDHFEYVGALGLGSRLKRLSEGFMSEVKKAYEAEGFDFEPRWFSLFSLLVELETTTVGFAAQRLQLTHPHVSLMAKELEKNKLISFKPNKQDARSRHLILTERGRRMAKQVQPLWQDIRAATEGVLTRGAPEFLSNMASIERVVAEMPFATRIANERKKRLQSRTRIVSYRPELKEYFARLNREWIEALFELEEHDHRFFKDPEGLILEAGGEIIFAEVEGEIVGTCALLVNEGTFELAKLAVTKSHKGLGLGEKLCDEICRLAKAKGAKSVFLTTNSSLTPAVRLYEKLGFQTTERGAHPKYKRVDLRMDKQLGL